MGNFVGARDFSPEITVRLIGTEVPCSDDEITPLNSNLSGKSLEHVYHKFACNPQIALTYRAAAVDWFQLLDMPSLALKLRVPAEENGAEAEWHDVSDSARGCTPAGKLRYVASLMERARCRGIGIESFYITDTERRVSEQPMGCRLSPELLGAMAAHGADFSYGAFSSYHEYSRYAIGSFYVLRFRKGLQKQLAGIITERMLPHNFHVWAADFNGSPYILLDAQENGLNYLIEQLASQPPGSGSPPTFRLDYFTNSPWCWVDLDADTIGALAAMQATLQLSIHRKMQHPRRGPQADFWRHVFQSARQHLSTR